MMDDELRYYYQEIKKYKQLSKEEQDNLLFQIKTEGDKDAYLKLYHSSLKLVVFVAKRYFYYITSLSKMDLIQEGNIGLLKAIEKYDLNYIGKSKFSSYAYKWINRYIERAIKNFEFTIRIPIHKFGELKQYDEAYDLLLTKLNREPTLAELLEELNMPIEVIRELATLHSKINVASLNEIVGKDEKEELISIISDKKQDILSQVSSRLDSNQLKKVILNCLTKKQANVIRLRYGFDDGIPKGYQEIANILQYKDRRNVVQIENSALKRIKKILEDWYQIENSNEKSSGK